jgi:hypothetical protein
MCRIITTCVGVLFMVTAFAPPLAQAITIAAPLDKAAQAANLTQDVVYVCRGLFWRRCWWVGPAPVVVAPAAPAVVARACPPGYHLGPAGHACRPN